jgi:uncharacterized repeat protein (TIGR03803 family)
MKRNQFSAAVSKVVSIAAIALIVALVLVTGAWAQGKYKILHKFTGADGSVPISVLIFDTAGNLYGTTTYGGCCGNGTVFKLAPNADGSWTHSVLYSFTGRGDGSAVMSGVTLDAVGNLYGTTVGGGDYGLGTVYKLMPNVDGTWTETVLHSFSGSDGWQVVGGLVFDKNGNLYGTATLGGAYGHGVVFRLAPNSDGSWTESVLHSFMGGTEGGYPDHGKLIFDANGNLYGATAGWNGGDSNGTVFELTPNSDGTWTHVVLHSFSGGADGATPQGTLTFDRAGSLYGTTLFGGAYGYGTIFTLTRGSDGKWKKYVVHQFRGETDGIGPWAGVVFDTEGNLYGTTDDGGTGSCSDGTGTGCGTVFKLSQNPNGGLTKQTHRFLGTQASNPYGEVLFDSVGNLFGTTSNQAGKGHGVVFEITP